MALNPFQRLTGHCGPIHCLAWSLSDVYYTKPSYIELGEKEPEVDSDKGEDEYRERCSKKESFAKKKKKRSISLSRKKGSEFFIFLEMDDVVKGFMCVCKGGERDRGEEERSVEE